MRRIVFSAALVVAAVVLTTIFQPLSHLESWAAPAAQAGCQTFKETGKTACGRFLQYWQQNGGLPQQGFPISNEFREKSDLNGQEYTVQYFERAVFEMHPENKPPYDVLLSQLGTFRFRAKYPNGEPGAPPPTPVPPPGVGTTIQVREGVTVTLLEQGTGLKNCSNIAGMGWMFKVKNTSSLDFVINVDRTSVYQQDNTGKRYPGIDYCVGNEEIVGAFEKATALPKGSEATGGLGFAADAPPNATYLEVHFTLSGTPLTFRYPLR